LAARNSVEGDEKRQLLERACDQSDRYALFQLGRVMRNMTRGVERAIELFRRAAELNHREAQLEYGELAFTDRDWERFHWWAKAAEGGADVAPLCCGVVRMLDDFKRGDCGRVLCTVAPVIRKNLAAWKTGYALRELMFDGVLRIEHLERVLVLHTALLGRARRAIDCWVMAGRRCGVVKDMRVVIAKMLWAEPWRWSDGESVEQERLEGGNKKVKRS
jgi:hypothetical protein